MFKRNCFATVIKTLEFSFSFFRETAVRIYLKFFNEFKTNIFISSFSKSFFFSLKKY
ncbi:hypothetical protein PUN28_019620 [Cardiocondyla obscurior]|uniref:Ribosomal protein L32 n=1 Tax=Cardiocondyla obscurior TaxID=286306 RepID=A0AAW2EAE0_9HYME